MVMLIDAGNSRVKWSRLATNKPEPTQAESYQTSNKAEQIEQLLKRQKPKRICMVHVLGDEFEQQVQAICEQLAISYYFVASTASCCGLINGYDKPEQLGADRFVALVGAYHIMRETSSAQLIVIDAGTAVTIDGLDQQGKHLGGVIMPGLQLWSQSLIKNTQLPPSSIKEDAEIFATATTRGINSGSIYGLSGAIEHVCKVMDKRFTSNSETTIRIICGGDSDLLATYLSTNSYRVIPDLIMHGLMIIEKNNA